MGENQTNDKKNDKNKKNDISNNETEAQILKSAMIETSRNAKRALPVIATFEVLMIINWFFSFEHSMTLGSAGYLTAYVILLFGSVLALAVIHKEQKTGLKNVRLIKIIQDVYAYLILVWSVAITMLDSYTRNSHNIIVFATIITIVPVVCYVSPYTWAILEGSLGIIIIMFSAIFFDKEMLKGFLINFVVFLIMSIIAETSFLEFRRRYYTKEYYLMLRTKEEYQAAREDYLTGLGNQRSYSEAILMLSKNDIPKNLIIGAFDLNGLKILNDQYGHKAGDEAIQIAAKVLVQSFGRMGTVYRVGGDEFCGIFQASKEEIELAKEKLVDNIAVNKGRYCKKVSISSGYSLLEEHPEYSLHALEMDADHEMYVNKKEYYEKNGMAYRG